MKKTILAAVAAGVLAAGVWADHIPVTSKDVVLEFSGQTSVILDIGDFDPFLEIQADIEDEELELRYRAVTLGTYYRLHRNVKVGAFYRLQAGVRHDDDWIDLSPGWEWEDSRDRPEHVLIADISPRFLLDFLPGENWVFMMKYRYLFNTYNSHHMLGMRQGLTYFLMKNREPLVNFSVQYQLYMALNFSETLVYKHYPYIDILFHLTPNIKLEASGAYKTVTWTTSQDVIDRGKNQTYIVDHRAWVVGLSALFMFDL